MSIGRKIREFGESRFSSVKEFADALEMAPSNLQSYMRDDFGVGQKILKKLRSLGCDLNWLLDDNDEKPVQISKEFYKLQTKLKKVSEEAAEYKSKLDKINRLTKEEN